MPEGAIHELVCIQIARSDYENLKYLYQNERNTFFQNVLQMADFRIRFLYFFSYMAWKLYESGVWKDRCFPFVKHGLIWRHLDGSLFRLGSGFGVLNQ